jgi:hypothetical protein
MLGRHCNSGRFVSIALFAALALPAHATDVSHLLTNGGIEAGAHNAVSTIPNGTAATPGWVQQSVNAVEFSSATSSYSQVTVQSNTVGHVAGRELPNTATATPEFSTVAMMMSGSGALLLQLAKKRLRRRPAV